MNESGSATMNSPIDPELFSLGRTIFVNLHTPVQWKRFELSGRVQTQLRKECDSAGRALLYCPKSGVVRRLHLLPLHAPPSNGFPLENEAKIFSVSASFNLLFLVDLSFEIEANRAHGKRSTRKVETLEVSGVEIINSAIEIGFLEHPSLRASEPGR